MGKGTIILLGILAAMIAVAAFIGIAWVSAYNGMVGKDEARKQSWAQVQNQYQRRYDLIPNLEAAVKGHAKHEEAVFVKISEARSGISSVMKGVTAEQMQADPELQKKFLAAQAQLSSALVNFKSVQEAYPQITADKSFLKFEDELSGTENRIAVARRDFTNAVQSYNVTVRGFFSGIVARSNGFDVKPTFEADEGAAKAPKVSFEK